MAPVLKAAHAAVNAAAAPPWRGRAQLGGLGALGLTLILVLTPPPALPASVDPELCVVRALDSRIVAPWLSVPRRAPGCSSHGRLGPGGTEVHAVRVLLDRDAPAVAADWPLSQGLPLLELILNTTPHNSSTAPLALLLATDRPVTWKITANGLSHHVKHSFTVCDECRVETAIKSAVILQQDWLNKRSLIRHANKTWHALTSFTEVHGGNRIELKVGYGVAGEESGECNTSSRQQSPVAAASLMLPQPSQGCLNEDSIGHNPRDVYVVELQGKNPGPGAVQIILQGEGPRPVPRNVTLVLKAHRPTRWQLGSHGIDGSIVVVSDQQVENSGIDVVVRSKRLPDGLDELLLSIFAEFGRPVLYAKTERASGLRLLIPSREYDERLSGDMAGDERDATSTVTLHHIMQQPSGLPGATLFRGFHAQESHARPLAELRKAMKLECESKRMIVTFPSTVVARLAIRRLALNDPSCVSQSNETHVWLSSHIASCGSISSSANGATHYSNSVHVRFGSSIPSDDEDGLEEEASGAFEDPDKDPDKLQILCKYLAQFPGGNVPITPNTPGEDGNFESGERPIGNPQDKVGNIYQMELYHDHEHTSLIRATQNSPVEVQFDETVYVRAWIENVVRVQVITESCWVSNSSDPRYQHGMVSLVRNYCPADLSVKVDDPLAAGARPHHGGFSFQVNKAYWQFGLLYVHCKLGVCTQDRAQAIGNLLLCVSQAQHCFRGTTKFYDRMVSTAQQYVSRGPLQPVPRRRTPPSSPTSSPIPKGVPDFPGIKIPSVAVTSTTVPPAAAPNATSVVQGITAEVAAGIALLSFLIGVCLTASMWCIQMRTDPMRQHRSKEAVQQRAAAAAAAAAATAPPSGNTSLVKPDGSQAGSAAI